MLQYRDFVPGKVKGKWYEGETYENFEAAVEAANQWLANEQITPIQIETVILPNVDFGDEDGTSDSGIEVVGGMASWFQILRIWY